MRCRCLLGRGGYRTGDRVELEFNPADSTFHVKHVPLRLWSERPGEVSWRCSCGAVMAHLRLPGGRFGGGGSIELRCVDDDDTSPRVVDAIEGQLPRPIKYGEESR